MRDLDIELPAYDEPTSVPADDECAHYERGENCGRTDCHGCGREAAAMLRCVALTRPGATIKLAREVIRVTEAHGVNIPDGALALGDLARVHAALQGNKWDAIARESWAWAEGVCEALTGTADVVVAYETAAENDAHAAGVQFVRDWQAGKDAFAAGATSSAPTRKPTPGDGHPRESGLGFESRAQHRPSSAAREQARRRVRG